MPYKKLDMIDLEEFERRLDANNEQIGIASELVSQGVSKDHIVLGFYSPSLREVGEVAVA